VSLTRHGSWEAFLRDRAVGRLVLLTTQGERRHVDCGYFPEDTLLVGRESAGVPAEVHRAADLRVRVPMRPGLRSLNVALAAAIVLGEALRQTEGLPP
jgi:tRNA (cytidine/uridine-2'-O-)-methyltransferase